MPITVQWKYKVGEKKAKKWRTGMTLEYTLRDDLKWQDGTPVTAADCVFALNLMRFQQNERYYYVWQPIYDVVQTGPYSFKIWWRDRYLYAHEYFGISLLCPKHIWEPWIDNPPGEPLVINYGAGPKGGDVWTSVGRHHSEFDLWDVAHPTDPTLTCLVGTDNFIYRDAGWDPGVAVYVDAWKNADNYMDRILTGDCNLDQFVDSSDSWHLLYRQGDFTGQCYPTAIGGHPRWDPIADIAYPAQKITGDEYVAYNNDYGQSWGP